MSGNHEVLKGLPWPGERCMVCGGNVTDEERARVRKEFGSYTEDRAWITRTPAHWDCLLAASWIPPECDISEVNGERVVRLNSHEGKATPHFKPKLGDH